MADVFTVALCIGLRYFLAFVYYTGLHSLALPTEVFVVPQHGL